MDVIKRVYEKYIDVVPYLFFGVCTTIVNIVVYWIVAYPLNMKVIPSTIVAWFFAVLFAYVTNRKWVFHSEVEGMKEFLKEITSFFVCRLATGVVDWLCMYIFVDILAWNDMIMKFLSNMVVIILNYLASKFWIFRNHRKS